MDRAKSTMRKNFLGTILCVALVVLLSACWAYADSAAYPSRAITMIVPYPPGGVTDLGARALAEAMEKHLGKSVTVMNRPGGSTTIGGNAVVTAKPDGYTLGFFPSSASIPEVYTYFYQAPYSGKNLRPVSKVAIPILTISVKGDSPINSVKDLIEYARKQPSVKVAVHNKTTVGFCAMKTIAKSEKVKLIDVPFDGDAKIVPAILGGHVPVGTPAYPGVQSLVEAKQIKVLAILMPKRADFAPNIPSIAELGYKLPLGTYLGVFAPKNTPDHIVKKLNDAIAKIAQEPEFRKKVHAMGIQVMFEQTSAFEKSIKEYADNLSAFFKEEGLVK
jgi:tripartite-type tricarboxylate transporter receptor subunit TctC